MVTRIRQLLDYKQLTPTQFADLIGVGRPVMSHILSERNKPSLDVVKQMSGAFPDISLPWLLFGTGDMLAAESASLAAATVPPAGLAPSVAPALSEDPAPIPEALPQASEVAAPVPEVSAALPRALQSPVLPPLPVLTGPEVELAPAQAQPVVASQPVLPPGASLSSSPQTAPASLPLPKPFRAARFVPPTPVPAAVPPATPAAHEAPAALPTPASVPTLAPAPPTPAVSDASAAAMLPFLTEPGKAIRRIVIFYRDGSFSDYQPE